MLELCSLSESGQGSLATAVLALNLQFLAMPNVQHQPIFQIINRTTTEGLKDGDRQLRSPRVRKARHWMRYPKHALPRYDPEPIKT